MADSDSGCVSAVADDNARTTDDLSIPPFLDRTNDAPTQTRLAEAKPTISAQVLTLVRRVKALIEKGDRAAETEFAPIWEAFDKIEGAAS